MEWILIDNLMPNEPILLNLKNITDFKWKQGTLIIGYVDGTENEYECDKEIFVQIASALNIIKEME